MKKVLIVFVLSLSMLACSSDDNPPVGGILNASYEFKIGNEVISSSDNIPLGMVLDGNTANQISVVEQNNEFMMMFVDLPINAGETLALNNGNIAIVGNRVENYQNNPGEAIIVVGGTWTRSATKDKVSFSGTFDHGGVTYPASGFIQCDGLSDH